MKRRLVTGVGGRIVLVVGAVVAAALLALTVLHVERQERIILAQNERNLTTVTESIIQGIKTIMLAGHADIGEDIADRIRAVADLVDLRTLRTDGTEAFRDNATIRDVNRRLLYEAFPPRPDPRRVQVLPPDDPRLRAVVESGRVETYYQDTDSGERRLMVLAPITAEAECLACHPDEPGSVRGVVEVVTSLAHVEAAIRETWSIAALALAATIVAILVFISVVVSRVIVMPIVSVTRGMVRAAAGNLDQEVPTPSEDEVGRMARSFNRMIEELRRIYSGLRYEKNKLTTIILGAREGIVVTDSDGDIVLVNPAAEELLGKPAERIVAEGFDRLFDDPEGMRRRLATRDPDTPPELISYNDRILSVHVARIEDEDDVVIGSAALMRDFTEEWRLQKKLERDSIADGLTGLYNRRYLDSRLAEEVAIARRHDRPLSVLLFDVDHFKAFNDTYGHDTGDRVLQGIAEVTRTQSRGADIPCRYGGEEFAVLLPNTGMEAAQAAAERLRAAVEAAEIAGHHVTISIGVATCPDHEATDADRLLKAADTALYQAKRTGRNRVRTAQPAQPA